MTTMLLASVYNSSSLMHSHPPVLTRPSFLPLIVQPSAYEQNFLMVVAIFCPFHSASRRPMKYAFSIARVC